MKGHFDEFCIFCQRARTNSVYSRPMDNIGQPSQHFPMKGTIEGKLAGMTPCIQRICQAIDH